MKLIGLKNTSVQTLEPNGILNLGSVYRIYDTGCGEPTFRNNSTSLGLLSRGIYQVKANITFTAPAAGDITFQLYENDVAIPGAIATETITTATTETKTTSIIYLVIVDGRYVLNTPSVSIKNISIRNTGLASTVSNVIVDTIKEVELCTNAH